MGLVPLIAILLLLSVASCMELYSGDLIQIIGLKSKSKTALSMRNQYAKIVGTQTETNQTIRYQVQLLSKDISGALKPGNLRRIGKIQIYPELRSSQTRKISMEEHASIGISTCQECLDEYRANANIPDNVFGFESAGEKLHAIKQYLEVRSHQTNNTKEYNAYLVGTVLSVNERILRQALHQKYPKRDEINKVILRFHANLIANINYADCTRYGTKGNFSESDTVEQVGFAFYLMYKSYGWKTQNWESLLFDVVNVLKDEFKSEYYAQEYRMRCFDHFVNYTLEEEDYFKTETKQQGVFGFPVYPGPYWPFIALQDVLSSKRIIVRYLADESKDIHIRINSPHVQSLKWFLKKRLNDLKYEYVDERVKECSVDYNSAAVRRFQQKMTKFIGENIA